MPQVPYKPVPSVTPKEGGPGPIGVRTPQIGPEAWGYNVGAALSHAGTVEEGVGTEMFNRAEAFQQLDNANEASMAAADFDKAAAQADYNLKLNEGKNAVDAYKTYDQTLEDARQRIRGRLTNQDAQRLYDNQTKTMAGRAYWAGANYASGQHKVYTDATDKAEEAMAARAVRIDPKNENVLKETLSNLEKTIRTQYADKGMSEDFVNEKVFEAKSTVTAGALTDLAKVNPTTAKTMLQGMGDKLTPGDRDRTMDFILDKQRHILPQQLYGAYYRGDYITLGQKKIPIERAGNAVGGLESSNNYSLEGIMTKHGRALGRYQVMEEFLPDFLKQAGMKPMTKQEFLADHAAQDQLFNTVFQKYQDQYGSFNEAMSHWFTGGSIAAARAKGAHDGHGTTIDKYLAMGNANLAKQASLPELEGDIQEAGKRLVSEGEDPLFPQFLRAGVEKEYAHQKQIMVAEAAANRGTVLDALAKPQADGSLIRSKDDLFRDPEVQKAYQHLDTKDKLAIEGHIIQNINNGYAITDEKMGRYHQLLDLTRTPQGQEELAKTNLIDEKLPWPLYNKLMTQQKAIIKQQGDDHLTHALTVIHQTLPDAPKDKAGSKAAHDRWTQFNGEVQDAIMDWTQSHDGKRPNDKEVQDIGRMLLRKQVGTWWEEHIGSGGPRTYMLPPTQKWLDEAKRTPQLQNATNDQLQRAYTRTILKRMQEGKEIERD